MAMEASMPLTIQGPTIEFLHRFRRLLADHFINPLIPMATIVISQKFRGNELNEVESTNLRSEYSSLSSRRDVEIDYLIGVVHDMADFIQTSTGGRRASEGQKFAESAISC